jgi:phage terminase large subunit
VSAIAQSRYYIAELKPGEKGGFCPRGALKTLWKTRDFETIVSGPAETGKTWGCLNYADALLWKYAGAQGVMCRKVYSTLVSTAIQTYRRILGENTPVKAFGGELPQWFDYPNGSRFWLAGMDNPGKALSSERDFVYINQAEELALGDYETILTRTTGRGAVMPYTRVFGDCNPGPPQHWIKQRAAIGPLRLLESRHADNPTLYDDDGKLTAQGVKTMAILNTLTGSRRLRLLEGKWSQAEGLVYESFDAARHIISRKAFESVGVKRYVFGVDWGYTNPGVLGAWAVDGDGRAYLDREVYQSKRTLDWWIAKAKEWFDRYKPEVIVCDPAEPANIKQFRMAGLPVIEGFNDISPGIQCVERRLQNAGDGKPRLFIVEDAREEVDDVLLTSRLPTNTREEFDSYSWPKGQDGKAVKEVPVDKDNHGLDETRYVMAKLDNLDGYAVPATTGTIATFAESSIDPWQSGGSNPWT